APPQLTVRGEASEFSSSSSILKVTQGGLVSFKFKAVDFKTLPGALRYRYQLAHSSGENLDEKNWSLPSPAGEFEWNAEKPGDWTFAVQFIDRDLNVSPAAMKSFQVVPRWDLNAAIMLPAGTTFTGLLTWAFVARSLYARKRREAERLREQILEQERHARA